MSDKDKYIERSKKVDLEYPHFNEFDKFELFALQGIEDGKKVIHVTDIELSVSQKRLFERTSEINSKFKAIQKLYELYLSDYADFNKSVNDYERKIPKNKNDKFSQEDNFNRRLIHILSSSVLFVTYFENEINRAFGKNSLQFKNWKKELGDVYDRDFAYRFCYHLRNYTQHEGLAIANVQVSLGNNNPEKECTCILEIDPKILVAKNYNWKKEIAEELKNMKENINLKQLLSNLFKSIISIYLIENTIFLESNHDELVILMQEHKKIYPENKHPYLLQTSKQELKKGKLNTFRPLCGLQNINKIYRELSNIGLVELK